MKPDYVQAWEWATGKVAELRFLDRDPENWHRLDSTSATRQYKGQERGLVWLAPAEVIDAEIWHEVPDLKDPDWRVDVEDGLLAKTPPMMVQFQRGWAVIFDIENNAEYEGTGPDIPAALCAAVVKARQAE